MSGLFFIAVILISNLYSQVTVEVSPIFSAISYNNSVDLLPEDKEIFELNNPPLTDAYKLIYNIENAPLRIIVLDKQDAINNNLSPTLLLNKLISKDSLLQLPNSKSKKGVIVAIANESERSVYLDYIVIRIGKRSPVVINQIKKIIEIPIMALNQFYILPKFKISVLPCGTVNAYSSPDVVICSELISDLFEKELSDALYPILLHEVAHSLLNLWNLPGYDNEDLADEFSAAILSRVAPEHIKAFIKYLEDKDSITEAISQLTEGSRHTISLQRARNMKAALTKIDQIEKRWENLLKPYERNKNIKTPRRGRKK